MAHSPFPLRSILMPAAFGLLVGWPMPHARAETPSADPTVVKPSDMQTGSLLIKTDRGLIPATRLKTDVDVTVSGPTARARVTQVFQNPTKHWIEGVYVYPLPEGAAVDTMKMVAGGRVIVADIAERQKAKALYEAARAAGQKAALTEQERPNIFTNSVANIGPGETVVVQVEYQEPVHQAQNQFSLRVPLVVAPRYTPAPALAQQADFKENAGGWGTIDPVPDRDRITPPVADPKAGGTDNPVTVEVHLHAGFPLGEVKSDTHRVDVTTPDASDREVTLTGANQADRDFELTWASAATTAPSVGLFKEHVGANDYLLAYLTPPTAAATQAPKPRDVTFVIDNSGSMGGTSIIGAKASLQFALDRLHPADRFNVIRFDDTMTELFPDSVPADPEHLAQARSFVASLEAAGGTEMIPPMTAALTDTHPDDRTHVRQIVFLTDGEIGNEQQIFDTIAKMRGRTKLFMVGIGSAPNGYLMTRAAEIGRGSYTPIATVDQVQPRMQSLVEKLESPAVTDLDARFSTSGVDMTPAALPDLYRGEPLVLAAQMPRAGGTMTLKGMIGDQPWSVTVPLDHAAEGLGLSKVWARRKIDDAEVARTMGRITQDEADKTVLDLALAHHLVTRLTSLVALDKTPSRPKGTPLTRADVPLVLPAGWDFDKVFGPQGEQSPMIKADADDAFDARYFSKARQAPNGAIRIASAAPAPGPSLDLPQTATDAELRLLLGLLLLVAGGLGLLANRADRKVLQ